MVSIPRRILTQPLVLTSGMGFDERGEPTYSGSTLASGSGYLKTTRELATTPAGIAVFDRVEVFSDPEEMTPRPGDQLETQDKTFRVRNVRPIADRDGSIVLHVSDVQEIEVA